MISTLKLNDGNEIPSLGFGVFMVENDGSCEAAVTEDLKAGHLTLAFTGRNCCNSKSNQQITY
ncbi:MAG: hypothetical protein PHC41_13400 [Lachnospiraceae bacterium]|nr:hypothetical protein [Lachnospiraceae bacterium]MDD3617201.1 hypothetical protein [Lachnospiraceae bacterium]